MIKSETEKDDYNVVDTAADEQKAPNGTVEFDEINEHLGAFGHWQRVIFSMICVADVFSCFCIMVTVFSGATPAWSCSRYTEGNMSYTPTQLNISENSAKTSCSFGNFTCTEFYFNDSFTSIVSEWSLVCDKQYVSDLISSIQMSGLLVGAALFGQMSDLVGRKLSFFCSHATLTVVGIISAVVPVWQAYAFCRFLVGIGVGGTMVVNCVYPLEFVGHRWRTLTGTIGFWAVGEMLLALIAFFLTDWKYLVLVTSSSGLVYFVALLIIPESPRWLVQKKRFKEAKVTLDKIALKNQKPAIKMSVLERFAQTDDEQENSIKTYTYLDLFRRWKYARITLASTFAWFTTFLTYYALSYNLRSFSGNRALNLFYAGIVDLAAMVIVMFSANRIGRRAALIGFLIVAMVCTLSLVCMVATDTYYSLGWVVVVVALLGKGSALGGTYICQIYAAELYPTVIRNLGLGIASISGRLGGILSPQIVYLGIYSDILPYIIPMILSLCVIPCVLTLKETNVKPLQDVYTSQTLHMRNTPEEEEEKTQSI